MVRMHIWERYQFHMGFLMNAYLFAAGNGMRLRPLTDNFQKCLLPVRGKPMLEWWLDAAFDSEIFDKVHVNIHHAAEESEAWISAYSQRKKRKVVILDERKMLLGTAGTLYCHADRQRDFMTAYTDTFSEDTFGHLVRIYGEWEKVRAKFVAGLVTFTAPGDGSTGNMMLGNGKEILSFAEKGNGAGIAWSGVMFARADFIRNIRLQDTDLARDVFPRLCGGMVAVANVDAYDIGRGISEYEHFKKY